MKYDVFISYRRYSFESANLIAEKLKSMGYNVFFDVETLRAGKFNEQLFKVIDDCSDFVLVLPPNALDRCHDQTDWVRKEVLYAINKGKNIVPVMLANFSWPIPMPNGMEELSNYQAITAGETEFFDLSMQRLASYLKSKKHKNMRNFYKKIATIFTAIILLFSVGGYIVINMANKLCCDIATSMSLEMSILNAARRAQFKHHELWLNYKNAMQEADLSPAKIMDETNKINNITQNHEENIKLLQLKASKYPPFTSFQKFLLFIYDFEPQNIEAFNSFYDVLFEMALRNISYIKSNTSHEMSEITTFTIEKNLEAWGYPFKSLYYNYMAEMSKMPKKAKSIYYKQDKFICIDTPVTLNGEQEEYERLATNEMQKYQKAAMEIQMYTERLKAATQEQERGISRNVNN